MKISDSAVEAAEAAIVAAAYADWDYPEPGVEGCARVLARAATVAILRGVAESADPVEMALGWHGYLRELADEIEKEQ